MRTDANLCTFLAGLPLFSALSTGEIENLSQLWKNSTIDADSIIFTKGDPGETIYLIRSGSVSISVPALENQPLILSILKDGDLIGELTLFEDVQRTATATSNTKTNLLEMPRKDFIEFLKSHPEAALSLIRMLGHRLQNANLMVTEQATRNVNEEIERELTTSERFADAFANFIGSWTFILIFLLCLAGWIILNLYILITKPIDPFPFILLNLSLSCVAAIQAPVIMMSQGRQAKKDRIKSDLSYKINLKEELMIQEILNKVSILSAKDSVNAKK